MTNADRENAGGGTPGSSPQSPAEIEDTPAPTVVIPETVPDGDVDDDLEDWTRVDSPDISEVDAPVEGSSTRPSKRPRVAATEKELTLTEADQIKRRIGPKLDGVWNVEPRMSDCSDLVTLAKQWDGYVKFTKALSNAFSVVSPVGDRTIGKHRAGVLADCIYEHLKLDLDLTWARTPDKRKVLFGCRSLEQFTQALWATGVIVPMAAVAKLYSLLRPEEVPESQREPFAVANHWDIWTEFPVLPMLGYLGPYISASNWEAVVTMGRKICKLYVDRVPEWWKQKLSVLTWSDILDMNSNFHFEPQPRLIAPQPIDDVPSSSRHPASLLLNVVKRGVKKPQSSARPPTGSAAINFVAPQGRKKPKKKKDLSKVQCYGCKEFGHYITKCPKKFPKNY